MIGFVLTGHGQFAPGLKSAVDMVAGEQPNFEVVPFAGSEAVTFGDDLRTCIAKMRQACDGVLVFVDLLGGTPFNQAIPMTTELDNVTVVTGTNLPMLVELVMTRAFGDPTLDELAERARVVGREESISRNSRVLTLMKTMRCSVAISPFIGHVGALPEG